jgi:hypothetical protein
MTTPSQRPYPNVDPRSPALGTSTSVTTNPRTVAGQAPRPCPVHDVPASHLRENHAIKLLQITGLGHPASRDQAVSLPATRLLRDRTPRDVLQPAVAPNSPRGIASGKRTSPSPTRTVAPPSEGRAVEEGCRRPVGTRRGHHLQEGARRWRAGGQLVAWAEPFHAWTWAIESAGGLGYLLAQQLVAAGETVVDVPATLGHLCGCGCSPQAGRTRTTPTTRSRSRSLPFAPEGCADSTRSATAKRAASPGQAQHRHRQPPDSTRVPHARTAGRARRGRDRQEHQRF